MSFYEDSSEITPGDGGILWGKKTVLASILRGNLLHPLRLRPSTVAACFACVYLTITI